MMNLFKKKEPQLVEVKGNQLSCPVCANTYFWSTNAQLNTSLASFFEFDWPIAQLPVLYVQSVHISIGS